MEGGGGITPLTPYFHRPWPDKVNWKKSISTHQYGNARGYYYNDGKWEHHLPPSIEQYLNPQKKFGF